MKGGFRRFYLVLNGRGNPLLRIRKDDMNQRNSDTGYSIYPLKPPPIGGLFSTVTPTPGKRRVR